MVSVVPLPGPVEGGAGVLEPQATEKSVIRIQERRITIDNHNPSTHGEIPGSIRASTAASMQARRYLAFVILVLVAAIGAEPIDAQSSLKSRVYATGLSSPVAFVQDPTRNSRQFVVEQG